MGSFRTLTVAVLAILSVSVVPVADGRADTLAAADEAAIRMVIESQIEAFRRDDGAAAYAHAAPGIQALFPSADIFMDMVRRGYRPVYRPGLVVFGALVMTPRGPVQRVLLTGPDGASWTALYTMERQEDGAWRIAGCVLVRGRDIGA